jgi:hypothetical protein
MLFRSDDEQQHGPLVKEEANEMQVRLVGDNASDLAQRWRKCGMVDSSDDENAVEFYPKPNSPGADALYDSYLKSLQAEARDVSVGLTLKDNTRLL